MAAMTKAQSIASIFCHQCHVEAGADDRQCRRCGAELRTAELEAPAAGLKTPTTWRELIDSRWAVLLLLFGVMGPLAIPILLKSRSFSTVSKVVLSVVVTIYIAALVWCAWLAVKSAYDQLQDLDFAGF